jgi:adenylate cyclase
LPLVLLAMVLTRTEVAGDIDGQLHDRITRLTSSPSEPSSVVLIDLDEASLAAMGPWPWPRTVIADLIQRLREAGVQVQIWDLFFPEPAPGDDVLNQALRPGPGKAGGDVVLGQVLVLDPQVQSPPRAGRLRASPEAPPLCAQSLPVTGHLGLAETLQDVVTGHLSSTPDRDGTLRRLPAVICSGAGKYPQLMVAAAELLEPGKAWRLRTGGVVWGPTQWAERGGLTFALDAQANLVVPYRRAHGQWPAVSALRVLEGTAGSAVPLKGKVVLVGATALGLADTVTTPFHAKAPGISVHAELLDAAITGRWTVEPTRPGLVASALFVLLALLLAALQLRLHSPLALAGVGLGVAGLPLLAAILARQADVLMPIAAPTASLLLFVLAMVALRMEAARRQVAALAGHLESFLPRHLAQEIARQNPSSNSLGRPETGVVLAMRVAGLERWCAASGSFKGLGLVHAITSLADKHARLQGGTLQHLLGDTFLLSWPLGASAAEPRQGPDAPHARQDPSTGGHEPPGLGVMVQAAIGAAQALFSELGAVLHDAESERRPLSLRVAIDYGPYLLAVAGTSRTRRTLVLGPVVDTTLGLLTLSEELASPLLLGEAAGRSLPDESVALMGQFLLPDAGAPHGVYRPVS